MRRRLTRAESRQQTRERLLAAAAEVFSRQGFHAATVEEVAETAGYSKGAVYSNFASKDELFLALLDQHLMHEFAAVGQEAAAGDSPQEQDNRAAPAFAAKLIERRAWNILVIEFWLYAMRNETARELLAARFRTARESLASQLHTRCVAEGVSPSLPDTDLAWTFLGLGTGLMLQSYLEPGALPEGLYQTATGQLLGDTAVSSDKGH